MPLQILGHQINSYNISTPIYEGPLDLLLDLIERAELDITKLALAQVTDQYLAYITQLQERDAAEVSAFLVIAAKLLQIKSEMLLPRPPQREPGEEDPGDTLAQQLIAYKRFKEIALWLLSREQQGLKTYVRLVPPPKIQSQFVLENGDLKELLEVINAVLKANNDSIYLEEVVAAPLVTIRERISHVLKMLNRDENVQFRSLFNKNISRLEIVVTFLALLELIKRNIVEAEQDKLFADIAIHPIGELQNIDEIELEFGE